MSEGKRPGGLTALAVINFVFGGFGLLAVLALLALFTAADAITSGMTDASGQAIKVEPVSKAMLGLNLLLSLASTALLIISGVGYLKQKKFLGQKLGSLYGLLGIATTVFGLVAANQSFGIGSIIGLIYPVLTLVLLNTTFKEDFVNP